MPPRAKIKRLPEDQRARIDAFLARENPTTDEFWEFLSGEMEIEIGRSSAGRYQKNFEKVSARLRESREMTEALAKELGDATVQGKQGRLLVEMARSLIFDMMMRIEEGGLDPKDVAFLGKGLAELSRALRTDQDFETKVREQAAKDAAERAVEAIEEQGQKHGYTVPPEALTAIRAQIYGIVDPA